MLTIAPIGTHDVVVDVVLDSVSASAMTAGDLITNGKITIPDCIRQMGGAAELKEFWLLQQDNTALGDLEKHETELYVFDNPDALGVLVSGDLFVLDATTLVTNIVAHKVITSGTWVDADTNNTYLHVTDINTVCKTSQSTGYSLYFALVTNGTPTFDDHTLTARFVFRQVKARD